MIEGVCGTAAWAEATDEFDRVRAVSSTLSQPRTAARIADEAIVDEESAQEYLDQLVDLGVLQRIVKEETTLYQPDLLYERMRSLRDLVGEHDRHELDELRTDRQEQEQALEGRERDLVEFLA